MTAAEGREIHDLVERYAQGCDRADGAAVAALFADDGVLETWLDPGSETATGVRTGRDEIAAAIDGLRRYAATHHTISSHSSTVDGMHATGETMCIAHHVEDRDGERHDRVLYIRYADTFALSTAGPWVFSHREVHVQWESTLPVNP